MSTAEISCLWKSFFVSLQVFLIQTSINVLPMFSLLLLSFAPFSHFSILPLIGMKQGPSFTSLLIPLPSAYSVWHPQILSTSTHHRLAYSHFSSPPTPSSKYINVHMCCACLQFCLLGTPLHHLPFLFL